MGTRILSHARIGAQKVPARPAVRAALPAAMLAGGAAGAGAWKAPTPCRQGQKEGQVAAFLPSDASNFVSPSTGKPASLYRIRSAPPCGPPPCCAARGTGPTDLAARCCQGEIGAPPRR